MNIKGYLFSFCFILLACQSFAQDVSHPIDKYLDSCIQKDYSTMGTVKCTEDALKLWDAELNKYFNLLMGILNEDSKNSLKYSETLWIKFKDSEFKNIDKIYSGLEGTMYIPMNAYDKMEIIKERALKLKGYYDLLTSGEKN